MDQPPSKRARNTAPQKTADKRSPVVPKPEPITFDYRVLFENHPVESLEEIVSKASDLLDKMVTTIRECAIADRKGCFDNTMLLKQIENTMSKAELPKTIIGIVGNTGAGKSSIINALLEEEKIVPTNCMRACTAAVTEISLNNDPVFKYRAEIEFISKEDWQKELEVLFDDIIESGDFDRYSGTPDSEAEIAWAKLKAIYPNKNEFKSRNIDHWLGEGSVSRLFKQKRIDIREDNALMFYNRLQKYINTSSKEKLKKARVSEISDYEKAKRYEMEYWPLIKVVRLYLRSEVLKTDAVLVNLPGTHGSNAARAAVAQSNMMQGSALWVVAPIHRALNDKSAKDLLGKTFRRQLYMDGVYQVVSFLCPKCDDFQINPILGKILKQEILQPSFPI